VKNGKIIYSNQITARVSLDVLPTGIVTSLLVTVTVPLLAVTLLTMGPVPDSTTFVFVNLSCFAASIVLYAPSTYEAVAATVVLSTSPSAKAGDITDNTAKMQNNFFIFVFLLGLANFVTYYERNQPALTLGFYY
jgi:hypothetical protein